MTSEPGMLWSADSLEAIEDISERFRQVLKRGALKSAKTGGRNLVTRDDVCVALSELKHAEWIR